MIHLILDKDATGEAYDRELRAAKAIVSKCKIVTKSNGTLAKNPIVMIIAGETRLVLTARNFMDAAYAILGCHPGATDRSFPGTESGTTIEGLYRGVGWTALHMEHMYVVSAEGCQGVSIAGDEASAKGLAEQMIDRMRPDESGNMVG